MGKYEALALVEGMQDAESEEQLLEAWQVMVDTGLAWMMNGSIGRFAAHLIREGLINE